MLALRRRLRNTPRGVCANALYARLRLGRLDRERARLVPYLCHDLRRLYDTEGVLPGRDKLPANSRRAGGAVGLDPLERADLERRASEALARQSIPGIVAHWVLVGVVLTTSSVSRAHPLAMTAATLWMALIGALRLVVANSLVEMRAARPLAWVRLFR